MSWAVQIRPEAEADLAEAYDWYESQRPGLGDEMLRAVEARFAAISRMPRAQPLVHKHV